MNPRLRYPLVSPDASAAMQRLEAQVNACGLEKPMLELVRMRVSQMNGCAFCLDLHARDARSAGESESRLDVLAAWREAPFYSDRERAALAWAEAVTDLHPDHVPDQVYEAALAVFSQKELVDLTLAVVAINGWNRLNIAFRTVPGTGRRAQDTAS